MDVLLGGTIFSTPRKTWTDSYEARTGFGEKVTRSSGSHIGGFGVFLQASCYHKRVLFLRNPSDTTFLWEKKENATTSGI